MTTTNTAQPQLIAMLRRCRDQFSFYATNHRAKLGNLELAPALRDDTLAKAEANEAMVMEIDDVLSIDGIVDVGSSDTIDLVNQPPHYTAGTIECIDALRAALTPEEFAGFCKGNSIKYAWRSGRKGDAMQDMAKSAWYARMAAGDDPRSDAS
jgi:hypothetical protein